MTDYKRLCNELLSYLYQCNWPDAKRFYALIERTRAALAKPEPDGPTLDEIDDLCAEHSFCYEDSESLECLLLIITDALARWGNSSAPQPISVSERPPGPEEVMSELSPVTQEGLGATHYEWELEDDEGEWQAGGSANSLQDVQREGMRYLQTYAQQGFHKLIIRQHCTKVIQVIDND